MYGDDFARSALVCHRKRHADAVETGVDGVSRAGFSHNWVEDVERSRHGAHGARSMASTAGPSCYGASTGLPGSSGRGPSSATVLVRALSKRPSLTMGGSASLAFFASASIAMKAFTATADSGSSV
jgi:hypothetical protein